MPDLEARRPETATDQGRMFPMQHGEPFIPWAQAQWFYRCYAALFGSNGQTLERLAERGGSVQAEVRVRAQDVVDDDAKGRYLRNIRDLPAGEAPPFLDANLVAQVEAIWAKRFP